VALLAAFPAVMQRDRRREGLSVCRAARLLGVTVRECRELEAGERVPDVGKWERISELYGWPQTFVLTPTRHTLPRDPPRPSVEQPCGDLPRRS
jgi:hypothetical protein